MFALNSFKMNLPHGIQSSAHKQSNQATNIHMYGPKRMRIDTEKREEHNTHLTFEFVFFLLLSFFPFHSH